MESAPLTSSHLDAHHANYAPTLHAVYVMVIWAARAVCGAVWLMTSYSDVHDWTCDLAAPPWTGTVVTWLAFLGWVQMCQCSLALVALFMACLVPNGSHVLSSGRMHCAMLAMLVLHCVTLVASLLSRGVVLVSIVIAFKGIDPACLASPVGLCVMADTLLWTAKDGAHSMYYSCATSYRSVKARGRHSDDGASPTMHDPLPSYGAATSDPELAPTPPPYHVATAH